MKNRIIYLMFLMTCNFCFSQTDVFYKSIFENEGNFKILKIFKGKIPKKFILVDSTTTIYPKSFWLDLDLKEEKIIKELAEDEHHPYNNVYIFSQDQYNNLISDDEKKYLFEVCQNVKSKKIKITEKKYFTVDSTKK